MSTRDCEVSKWQAYFRVQSLCVPCVYSVSRLKPSLSKARKNRMTITSSPVDLGHLSLYFLWQMWIIWIEVFAKGLAVNYTLQKITECLPLFYTTASNDDGLTQWPSWSLKTASSLSMVTYLSKKKRRAKYIVNTVLSHLDKSLVKASLLAKCFLRVSNPKAIFYTKFLNR